MLALLSLSSVSLKHLCSFQLCIPLCFILCNVLRSVFLSSAVFHLVSSLHWVFNFNESIEEREELLFFLLFVIMKMLFLPISCFCTLLHKWHQCWALGVLFVYFLPWSFLSRFLTRFMVSVFVCLFVCLFLLILPCFFSNFLL